MKSEFSSYSFNYKQIFASILFLMFASLTMAQIKLVAEPSREEVVVNQRFNVHFYVAIPGNQQVQVDEYLKLPDGIKNFQEIGVLKTQTSSIINNTVLNKVGEKIEFVATKKGTFKIGKATIVINGKKYYSKPFVITVSDKPKTTDRNTGQRLEGAFLSAELENKTPYVNEETILSVKLYARDYSLLNRKSEFKEPKFKNFETKAIKIQGNNYQQEMVDGKVFISQEIARYVLFPKKNKPLTIDPFSINLILSNYFASEKVKITTDRISVKPKSLPTGAPKSFKGAVGDFKLISDIDKTSLKNNQSVNLDIELIGNGNLNMIQIPELSLPKEVEVYNPKKREAIIAKNSGLKGKIVNEYVIVPQYGGVYSIDPIEFTYFNPKEKKYKTIKTKPIKLNVDGPPPPKPKIAKKDTVQKKDEKQPEKTTNTPIVENTAEPTVDNFEEFPTENDEVVIEDESTHKKISENGWVWAGAGAGALLLLLGIVILEKRHKKRMQSGALAGAKVSVREKRKELNNELKKLEELSKAGNQSEFYIATESLLTEIGMYLSDLEQADFTPDSAYEIIKEKQNEELASDWKNYLLDAKQSQYSPIAGEIDLQDRYDKINHLIDDLFKRHY